MEARDAVLGPADQRTSTRPVDSPTGCRVGGTAFEREEHPTGVHGARAFTLACSTQHQNSVYSPVAWGKLPREGDPGSVDELPANRQIRARYLKVVSSSASIYP